MPKKDGPGEYRVKYKIGQKTGTVVVSATCYGNAAEVVYAMDRSITEINKITKVKDA